MILSSYIDENYQKWLVKVHSKRNLCFLWIIYVFFIPHWTQVSASVSVQRMLNVACRRVMITREKGGVALKETASTRPKRTQRLWQHQPALHTYKPNQSLAFRKGNGHSVQPPIKICYYLLLVPARKGNIIFLMECPFSFFS